MGLDADNVGWTQQLSTNSNLLSPVELRPVPLETCVIFKGLRLYHNLVSAGFLPDSTKTLQPPTMDSVCLQKTRFHANPATEPLNGRQAPQSAWSKPPIFLANQPVLWGFRASRYKMGGSDSKPPTYFAKILSFVGASEGLGNPDNPYPLN